MNRNWNRKKKSDNKKTIEIRNEEIIDKTDMKNERREKGKNIGRLVGFTTYKPLVINDLFAQMIYLQEITWLQVYS